MAIISLQCISLSQIHQCLLQTDISMIGREYITSLAKNESVIGQRSECTKREFEKTSRVHTSSHKPGTNSVSESLVFPIL